MEEKGNLLCPLKGKTGKTSKFLKHLQESNHLFRQRGTARGEESKKLHTVTIPDLNSWVFILLNKRFTLEQAI